MRKRVKVDNKIYLIYDTEKTTGQKFEVVVTKNFKKLSDAQRLFRHLLLNVTKYVYLGEQGKNSYCVQFHTYTHNMKDAIEMRDDIQHHFDSWNGKGFNV